METHVQDTSKRPHCAALAVAATGLLPTLLFFEGFGHLGWIIGAWLATPFVLLALVVFCTRQHEDRIPIGYSIAVGLVLQRFIVTGSASADGAVTVLLMYPLIGSAVMAAAYMLGKLVLRERRRAG